MVIVTNCFWQAFRLWGGFERMLGWWSGILDTAHETQLHALCITKRRTTYLRQSGGTQCAASRSCWSGWLDPMIIWWVAPNLGTTPVSGPMILMHWIWLTSYSCTVGMAMFCQYKQYMLFINMCWQQDW